MRQHNTDSEKLIFDQKYIDGREISFKPLGLWYDLNGEWVEWCESEMPGWIKKYLFEIDVDMETILVVDTSEKVLKFFDKYKTSAGPGLPEYYQTIDWQKLAQDYKGFEIDNYYDIKWGGVLPRGGELWLSGWDVNSGCIWDLTAIKSFERKEVLTVS